jgi:hypothetical protein
LLSLNPTVGLQKLKFCHPGLDPGTPVEYGIGTSSEFMG